MSNKAMKISPMNLFSHRDRGMAGNLTVKFFP